MRAARSSSLSDRLVVDVALVCLTVENAAVILGAAGRIGSLAASVRSPAGNDRAWPDRVPGGRSAMAVKVIVELKAKPGRRDELRSLIEQLATRDRPTGYHGSTYYESLDDPDLLIDIADWESPEARTTHLTKAMAAGAYVPALELVAGPFRATVIRRLH
jgi:quinol monooxygenase YgiN